MNQKQLVFFNQTQQNNLASAPWGVHYKLYNRQIIWPPPHGAFITSFTIDVLSWEIGEKGIKYSLMKIFTFIPAIINYQMMFTYCVYIV